MNLFLNAVTSNWVLILFDDKRKIIDKEIFSILLNESSKLVPIIDNFIKKNNLSYSDIDNIVVVNWPGSFTWVRTISLVVNTLSYTFENIKLTPIVYFDLFENFPIAKASSKRDLFVKKSKDDIIEIIKNEDFIKYIEENSIKEVFWENFDFNSLTKSNDWINYETVIWEIKFENKKQIEAYYLKKPSIS